MTESIVDHNYTMSPISNADDINNNNNNRERQYAQVINVEENELRRMHEVEDENKNRNDMSPYANLSYYDRL